MTSDRPRYNLFALPSWRWKGDEEFYTWTGSGPPPKLGERVSIVDYGPAIVTGYFTMGGELGIEVQPEEIPDWLKESRARSGISLIDPCRFFGHSIATAN